MTIEVSSTDRRDGKALALFARWQDWQQGKTKDGCPFFAISGSEPNLLHMSDARECSCPDFQRCRNVCKHVRAVRLWMAAFATGAVTPKSRPATPGVVDDSGTGDDLIILTPKGAAFLAAQYATADAERDARQVPGAEHAVTATSFRPCIRKCGELLAPEYRYKHCESCWERISPVFATA